MRELRQIEEASRRAQRRVRFFLVAFVAVALLGPLLGPALVVMAVDSVCRAAGWEQDTPAEPPRATTTRPMPDELLPGQVSAERGCPSPYVALRGKKGCWNLSAAEPPCGATYEYQGKCYTPYVVVPRMPSVQDPWWRE